MISTVAHEPSAMALEPALERSSFHSGSVAVAVATMSESVTQASDGLDDSGLDRERDPLGDRRFVSEVAQRADHVDPSLMPCRAL